MAHCSISHTDVAVISVRKIGLYVILFFCCTTGRSAAHQCATAPWLRITGLADDSLKPSHRFYTVFSSNTYKHDYM